MRIYRGFKPTKYFMNSAERRLKLLLLLQSNRKLTVNDIADYFGISRRTVFRDMRSLQEMEVPVTHEQNYGYGLMKGYNVPPLMFTPKQMAIVIVGLSFVKSQVDETMIEDAREVEMKIQSVVPSHLKNFINELESKAIVDPFSKPDVLPKRGGNWFVICNAITEKNSIRFSYFDKKKIRSKDRIVDPYLLVHYGDHWNVLGFDHSRKDIRNFILDRMSDVLIQKETFMPGKFNPEELIYRLGEKAFTADLLVNRETVPNFKAKLPALIIEEKEYDELQYRIRFRFDNLDFLNRWLLQFPDDVKIVGPKKLIKRRKTLLHRMLGEIESD
jgi:predicted DNA-binding transcriptional regulator YafY